MMPEKVLFAERTMTLFDNASESIGIITTAYKQGVINAHLKCSFSGHDYGR